MTTRRDQFPLENIVDFIDNKFSTTCILALVHEKQQQTYNVFVFLCSSDRDAADLIKNFKTYKRQLRGEGYNVDVTSKGKNWVLTTKEQYDTDEIRTPVHQQNGNGNAIRVREKVEGNVIYVGMGGRNQVENDQSKSEFRDELYHIAGEIRDIKRMLNTNTEQQEYQTQYQYPQTEIATQPVYVEREKAEIPSFVERRANRESKGRLQFEKHYGYRIFGQTPSSNVQTVQTMERSTVPREIHENVIVTKQIEPKRQTVYLKKNKQSMKKHFVSVTPTKTPSSVKSRSSYYTTASVPPSPGSNLSYTKRVYDSANPYLYATQRVYGQPGLTLVATNKKHRFRQRSPLRKAISLGSDIVPRNIEDVYKHRTFRRIIVPPPAVSPSVMEYVNVQSSQRAPSTVHVKSLDHVEHVEYLDSFEDEQQVSAAYPPIRGVYENREDHLHLHQDASFANISTNVNVSNDDGLDDNVILNGEDDDYRDVTNEVERDGNVVIIRAGTEQAHSTYSHNSEPVHVETTYDDDDRQEEPRVYGGGVYHVQAVSVDEYENSKQYGGNVTIISASDSHVVRNSPIASRAKIRNESINGDRERVIVTSSSHVTHSAYQDDGGLFGAYTKRAGANDNNSEIVATTSYKYHDDDDAKSKSDADDNADKHSSKSFDSHSTKSDVDEEGAIERHVHYSTEDVHIIDRGDESAGESDKEENSEHNFNDTDGIGNENNEDDNDGAHMNLPDEESSDNDEDENYTMDMDALKRSMEEPELQIVASSSSKVENSISYTASHETDSPSGSRFDYSHDRDRDDSDSETERDRYNGIESKIVDEVEEHVEETVTNGDSKTSADRDAFARQFLDEDAIRLITNRSENSVLF